MKRKFVPAKQCSRTAQDGSAINNINLVPNDVSIKYLFNEKYDIILFGKPREGNVFVVVGSGVRQTFDC